jgi:Guanylate-binding protein, C-terminal domain/Guanylate-binding protein, N-terminal domain
VSMPSRPVCPVKPLGAVQPCADPACTPSGFPGARADASSGTLRGGELSSSLLVVIRDAQLQLRKDDNSEMDPRDSLEDALEDKPGDQDSMNAKRKAIRDQFPSRDCCTLVCPVGDRRKLDRVSALHWGELNAEFRAGLHKLVETCKERTVATRVAGSVVTGQRLAHLLELYVRGINTQGVVPDLGCAWQAITRSQCRDASAMAVQRYQERYEADAADFRLEDAHQAALQAASAVFVEVRACGSGPYLAVREGSVGPARLHLWHPSKIVHASWFLYAIN